MWKGIAIYRALSVGTWECGCMELKNVGTECEVVIATIWVALELRRFHNEDEEGIKFHTNLGLTRGATNWSTVFLF